MPCDYQSNQFFRFRPRDQHMFVEPEVEVHKYLAAQYVMQRLTLPEGCQPTEEFALLFPGDDPVGMKGQMEPGLTQIMFHKVMKEMFNLFPTVLMIEFLMKNMPYLLE